MNLQSTLPPLSLQANARPTDGPTAQRPPALDPPPPRPGPSRRPAEPEAEAVEALDPLATEARAPSQTEGAASVASRDTQPARAGAKADEDKAVAAAERGAPRLAQVLGMLGCVRVGRTVEGARAPVAPFCGLSAFDFDSPLY